MKTKKSVKVIKESPSSLAFSSLMKRKLLTELTTAQHNVKKKFKKAYMERMKREREMDKVFKPITKKIAALTGGRKKKRSHGKSSNSGETNGKRSDDDEDGVDNDQSYYDDKLHDSAFESSQFRAGKASEDDDYDFETTTPSMFNTAIVKSPLLSWRGNITPKNLNKRFGEDWRGSVLKNLLRQNHSPTTAYTPLPKTDQTRKSILNPETPNVSMLMELEQQQQRKTHKGNKNKNIDRRALEIKRLDSNLINIDMTPSSSKFRSVGKRGAFRETYGQSIDSNFIPYTANDRIVYEYFDDPNELCERLRLLSASRAAGNTNHAQEINSILEELRELGHI